MPRYKSIQTLNGKFLSLFSEGEKKFELGCAPSDAKNYCDSQQTRNNATVFCDVCEFDKCNSAETNSQQFAVMLVLASVIALMVVLGFYCMWCLPLMYVGKQSIACVDLWHLTKKRTEYSVLRNV